MDRKEYKRQHNASHYERFTLSLPIGTKQIIKDLAKEKDSQPPPTSLISFAKTRKASTTTCSLQKEAKKRFSL